MNDFTEEYVPFFALGVVVVRVPAMGQSDIYVTDDYGILVLLPFDSLAYSIAN